MNAAWQWVTHKAPVSPLSACKQTPCDWGLPISFIMTNCESWNEERHLLYLLTFWICWLQVFTTNIDIWLKIVLFWWYWKTILCLFLNTHNRPSLLRSHLVGCSCGCAHSIASWLVGWFLWLCSQRSLLVGWLFFLSSAREVRALSNDKALTREFGGPQTNLKYVGP